MYIGNGGGVNMKKYEIKYYVEEIKVVTVVVEAESEKEAIDSISKSDLIEVFTKEGFFRFSQKDVKLIQVNKHLSAGVSNARGY